VIEQDAVAARQAGTQPRRAYEDQRGNLRLDAQFVERLPRGIAGRPATGPRHREPDEPGRALDTATQLAHTFEARMRVDVDPVTDDRVGVRALGLESVVVHGPRFVERNALGESEVEHC